jgi:acyl dehydratase
MTTAGMKRDGEDKSVAIDQAMGGLITDAALSELRSRIGSEVTTHDEPNLTEATKDAIRHWVRAIGDRDRKWTDEEYAAGTRFKGIIAPPSILYAFTLMAVGDRGGLPGIHSFFSGAESEWYLPIKRNDQIKVKAVLKAVNEKSSRFARRMLQQISEVTFTNQHGDVVARSWPWGMRTERSTAKVTGKYDHIKLATYTPEAIERISSWYDDEPKLVRGANPRYWEDVTVGEEIPEVLRGPWTSTIGISFVGATGGMFTQAHGYWYEYLRRHPRAGLPNEQGVPEGPIRGHWDSEFARRIGVPAAYDFGPERIAWLCSLMTYWCGDDGWLKRLRAEVRQFNVVGDLATLGGKVTGKREENGEALVDCDIWVRNQRGDDICWGNATVMLPRSSSSRRDTVVAEQGVEIASRAHARASAPTPSIPANTTLRGEANHEQSEV